MLVVEDGAVSWVVNRPYENVGAQQAAMPTTRLRQWAAVRVAQRVSLAQPDGAAAMVHQTALELAAAQKVACCCLGANAQSPARLQYSREQRAWVQSWPDLWH